MLQAWASIHWFGAPSVSGLFTMTVLCGAMFGVVRLTELAMKRRVAAPWLLIMYQAVFVRALLPTHYEGVVQLPAPELAQASVAWLSADTFALVHLVGVVLLLARWAAQHLRLTLTLRSAHPIELPEARGIRVVAHPTLGPAVFGLMTPRIVLPRAVVDGADDDRALIVAHELAHLRRRDGLVRAVVRALTIVFWPLAPLWLAERRIAALLERACDEAALKGAPATTRRRYGELLLKALDGPKPTFALSFYRDVYERIEALKPQHHWPRWASATTPALVAVVALSCASRVDATKRISLDLREASTANVIRILADVSGADIQVDAAILDEPITMQLHDTPWREALDRVATQAHAHISERNGWFVVQRGRY